MSGPQGALLGELGELLARGRRAAARLDGAGLGSTVAELEQWGARLATARPERAVLVAVRAELRRFVELCHLLHRSLAAITNGAQTPPYERHGTVERNPERPVLTARYG